MMILSVIIPVYNLEQHISHCLDSIYNQFVNESLFEVITINDGSKDGSLRILQEYATKHGNLVVLNQDNRGVSAARNNGIYHAKGKYITFIDGDDQMEDNAIANIVKLQQTCSCDFDVCYGRSFIQKEGHREECHLWYKTFQSGKIYNGSDLIYHHYINGGSVCGGVYRTHFLIKNNLFFGEGIANGEDTIFNYILYALNPRIIFADIPINLIMIRQGSASHSPSIKRVEQFWHGILYLEKIEKKDIHTVAMQQAIDASYYHIISLAVNMYIKIGGRDWRYMRDLLKIKKLHKLYVPWLLSDQKMKINILNKSFYLYFKLLVLKNIFKR